MENKDLYRAYDVAKLVASIYRVIGKGLFGTRLHRILYVIQIEFMKNYDYPCFSDDMTAWDYGPVIANQYHEIRCLDSGFHLEKEDFSNFKIEHLLLIKNVINNINEMDLNEFFIFIKDQQSFKDAYGSNNKVITPADVAKDIYYKEKTKVLIIGKYKHLN